MSTIEQSIELDVPVQTAYNQWTQFEEFPKFMEGVEEIRQIDDRHMHWVAEFGGTRHEWDAEITEQLPDERVAWKNTDGKENAGVVTFHKLDDTRSRVMVQMDFVPEGIKEKIGDAIGAPDRRVKGDLRALQGDDRGARQPRPAPGAARSRARGSTATGHGTLSAVPRDHLALVWPPRLRPAPDLSQPELRDAFDAGALLRRAGRDRAHQRWRSSATAAGRRRPTSPAVDELGQRLRRRRCTSSIAASRDRDAPPRRSTCGAACAGSLVRAIRGRGGRVLAAPATGC